MNDEPNKQYKFKPWVSTSERAEVMKIIKYTEKGGLIGQIAYESYPELQNYFEQVKD